jgi:hypothetical protein
MYVVSFCFESILALFYHPNSLQWIEIHAAAKFDAVRLLSQKLFLQLTPSVGIALQVLAL